MLIHSLIHSFTHSLIHSFTHSLIHSFTHSLIHSLTHSRTHARTHAHTHTHTHAHSRAYTHTRCVHTHARADMCDLKLNIIICLFKRGNINVSGWFYSVPRQLCKSHWQNDDQWNGHLYDLCPRIRFAQQWAMRR